ncbi:hypothetical protein AB0H18_32995, partial [Streptomyces sp. NPDC020766]|uniref:hypothetical protein n=1 Tax=Streptomyces sp. NPDC020766 TaxID=3155011 RepID=UPI0033CACAB3
NRTPRRIHLPRLQPHLLETPQEDPIMIVLRAQRVQTGEELAEAQHLPVFVHYIRQHRRPATAGAQDDGEWRQIVAPFSEFDFPSISLRRLSIRSSVGQLPGFGIA